MDRPFLPRQPTPKRWKGLNEPVRVAHRPQASRRMSGLDALEYRAMAIPKSENSYIIPPRRNKKGASSIRAGLQPPVKKARVEEEEGSPTVGLSTSMKRPLENAESVMNERPISLDGPPEKKKVRFYDRSELLAARDAVILSPERNGDTGDTTTTAAQSQEETTTDYVAVDVTNMTFESLVFKRLKELCQEHGIVVPKGAKKKDDLVALLSEKISSPNHILDEEPYSSFTKEALELKCRDLNLTDTGSKSKLVERLEAFSDSD